MQVTTAPTQAAALLTRLFRAWASATDARQAQRLERMIAAAFDLAGPAFVYTSR